MIRMNSLRTVLRNSALNVSSTDGAASSTRATPTRLSQPASPSRCAREHARRTNGCARPRYPSDRPRASRYRARLRVKRSTELAIESGQAIQASAPFRRQPQHAAIHDIRVQWPPRQMPADRSRQCSAGREHVPTPRGRTPDPPTSHAAQQIARTRRTHDRSHAADRDTHPHSTLPPHGQWCGSPTAPPRTALSAFRRSPQPVPRSIQPRPRSPPACPA